MGTVSTASPDQVPAWPGRSETLIEWTPRTGLPVQAGWLSHAELARMHGFVSPLGERWAAARCWVRARLALRLGCSPEQVPLVTDARGRPGLVGRPGALAETALPEARTGTRADSGTGDVNIAHTEHVLVLAISGHRVGVDVEERPAPADDPVGLAEIVGTQQEVEELKRLAPAQRAAAFQRWWVRKEAVLKADGAGFLTDPRLVHVGVTESQPPEPWAVLDHGALRPPDQAASIPHTLLATAHDLAADPDPAGVSVVLQAPGLR